MKLNKITFALLAGLCLFACKEDEPVVPGPDPVDPDPVVPVELNNQYAIDEEIHSIGSVVEYNHENHLVFALYEQEGIIQPSEETTPAIEIRIAPALLGETIDLAANTAEEVTIIADAVKTDALTGTLQITVDEENKNVTIVLESEDADQVQLRAHYDSSFATHVILNNQYLLNDAIKPIGSVVKYDYDAWTVFALYEQEGITDASTTAPIELYMAPSALNKVIDLATTAPEEAFISMSGLRQPTGTLEVVWDETQGTVSIQLEAEENDTQLRAHYNGAVASYIELENQYLVNNEVKPIHSVVELEVEGGYRLGFYEEPNVFDFSTTPAIDLFIATTSMGQVLDLATVTPEQATISVAGLTNAQLTGTLEVKFGRTGNTLEVELNAKTQEDEAVRANYDDVFAITYTANPHFTVTSKEGVTTSYGALTSILRKAEGGKTNFAFADNSATTAEGCLEAHAGVWFALTPYKGEVDATNCTFTFIDYDNNKVYDSSSAKVKEGTISTKQATDGKVYISMNVTLDNGIVIDAEYFGEATDVTNLNPMLPAKEYGFYYYDGNGTLKASAIVDKVTLKTTSKGLLEFSFGTTNTNSMVYDWPKLTISPDFVNNGVIDCSNLPLNSFILKYSDFQMESASGNEYKDPYIHIPTNGTLEVKKDENGQYSISLDMINEYTTGPATSESVVGGSKYRLVITYEGTVIEQ